jgi:hypothetical protein
MKTDPKEHFKYPACVRCLERPCGIFRYHQQNGDKFRFVHNARYNPINPCPFASTSFEEVERLLDSCEIHELDEHLRGLMTQMTPDELLRLNKDHYIDSYLDRAGRMEYLRRLWEDRIFAVIRVPRPFRQDEKMKEWFAVS